MAEVIDLNTREVRERKRLAESAQRRAAAVAGALSCGLCPHRCVHCGMSIETPQPPPADAPYPFCGDCLEELRAFKRMEQGGTKPEAFWHTEEWAAMWRTWLAYMKAGDKFRGSAAFLRLMATRED